MKNWENAYKAENVSKFYFWLAYAYDIGKILTTVFYGFLIFYPLSDNAFFSAMLITLLPYYWVKYEIDRMEKEWWQQGKLNLSSFLMLFVLPLGLYKIMDNVSVSHIVLTFFNLLFLVTFILLEMARKPISVPKSKIEKIRQLNRLLQPLLYLKEEKVRDVLSHIEDLSTEEKETVLECIRNKESSSVIDYLLSIYIKK